MVFRPISYRLKGGLVTAIRHVIAVAASFVFLFNSASHAAERWADPNLPVRDGLQLWLDAARAIGDQPLAADAKLNQWRDASGKNRNLEQSDVKAQPSLLKIGNAAIVRFDGIDDQFRALKLGTTLDSFTIVMVAAPRQNLGGFAAFMALNAANERDYASGVNVDLGPTATGQFSML